jgi:hypothetical protein
MKAHALIGGSTYDPETLKVVYKAFDTAWDRIEPGVSDRLEAIAAARMKLAEAVLEVAKSLDDFDVNGLAELALERMYAGPTKLGLGG